MLSQKQKQAVKITTSNVDPDVYVAIQKVGGYRKAVKLSGFTLHQIRNITRKVTLENRDLLLNTLTNVLERKAG